MSDLQNDLHIRQVWHEFGNASRWSREIVSIDGTRISWRRPDHKNIVTCGEDRFRIWIKQQSARVAKATTITINHNE